MRVFDQGAKEMLKKRQPLPKAASILNNEEGVVIIAALMVLVLLTIIGIASTNISNTEIKIASHGLIHQQNFYQAEGATLIALEEMEELANPKVADPTWMWQQTDSDSVFTGFEAEMACDSNLWKGDPYDWEGSTVTPDATPETLAADVLSDTRYFVVYRGILPGEPLEIGMPKRYRYAIYGRCEPLNRGATTVEIGYIKAY
jgi:hypothetical protein